VTNMNCSYCGRKGLLLYPVRYAVACPNGQKEMPALSGNFKIDGAPSVVAPAKYTLRALRTGYLYAYEEKQKRLKAYIVLPKGGLFEFPVEYEPIVDPHRMNDCCLDRVNVALSYCIDIEPLPCELMGNIWIGWSNVLWTKPSIAQVSDPSWRKKHMQCIDAQAMLNGLAPHAAGFKDHADKLPHFSASDPALAKAFDFSNTPASREAKLRSKRDDIARVMNQRCPYGGFIVAVNDPVGITNDLSELTSLTHHTGFDEEIYRGEICGQLIHGLEQAVRQDARKAAEIEMRMDFGVEQNPQLAKSDWGRQVWRLVKAGGPAKYEEQKKVEKKKYGDSVASKIAAAEDRAWKEFTSDADGKNVLDHARIQAFPERYASAVKRYEPVRDALAKAHCAWLKSEQLSRWMDGTHDPRDIRCGFSYRESLAQCIGKAVATQQCEAALKQWLGSCNVSDPTNLYARALLFNHQELIDAAGVELRGADFKPKYFLSIYKGALARFTKRETAHLIDRLALNTANILARALGEEGNEGMRRLTLLSLTLLGRTVIKPSNLTKHELSKWVIAEAQAQGIKFDQTRTARRASARKEAKRVLPRASAAKFVSAFELDIKSLEADGTIRPGTLRVVGIPGRDLIKEWCNSSDFNTGAVGVVLQLCALYFVTEDLKRADEFDRGKVVAKVAFAAVALSASLLEAVSTVLDKAPTHPLSRFVFGHWNFGSAAIKIGIKAGKMIGGLAGLANGIMDVVTGIFTYKDGDEWLGGIYVVNGALSAALAIVAGFTSIAVFWPLFVLAFLLSIFVAIIRTPPLVKWIRRCYFSIQTISGGKSYSSLDEELSAFNGAIGD
jgi:hypothetical protein